MDTASRVPTTYEEYLYEIYLGYKQKGDHNEDFLFEVWSCEWRKNPPKNIPKGAWHLD